MFDHGPDRPKCRNCQTRRNRRAGVCQNLQEVMPCPPIFVDFDLDVVDQHILVLLLIEIR